VTGWLLDFSHDAITGLVGLELHADIAWYTTLLRGLPDIDGIIIVRDHEVPLPRQGLEIRADGLWAEFVCETPREHWTFGLEAFGLRVDAIDDVVGDRMPVGLDLEWDVGAVHGDVLVGRERFAIDGTGSFAEGDAPTLDDDWLEEWLRRTHE
jgi:hypothetical protein